MFDLVLKPKIGVIMVDQKDPPGRQASNFTLVLKGLKNKNTCVSKSGIRGGCCNPSYWEDGIRGWHKAGRAY